MEPKPETVQLIKWKWWLNNYYFTSQRIFDTGTLQSTYNLSAPHWDVHSGDCMTWDHYNSRDSQSGTQTMDSNVMVWSNKFGVMHQVCDLTMQKY